MTDESQPPQDYSTDTGPWTLAKLMERLSIKNKKKYAEEESNKKEKIGDSKND